MFRALNIRFKLCTFRSRSQYPCHVTMSRLHMRSNFLPESLIGHSLAQFLESMKQSLAANFMAMNDTKYGRKIRRMFGLNPGVSLLWDSSRTLYQSRGPGVGDACSSNSSNICSASRDRACFDAIPGIHFIVDPVLLRSHQQITGSKTRNPH